MKYISLLLLSCTILACLPDKTQAHKYHQTTFEVVEGRLVESEEDLIPAQPPGFSLPIMYYGLILYRPKRSKDTIVFPPPLFRIPYDKADSFALYHVNYGFTPRNISTTGTKDAKRIIGMSAFFDANNKKNLPLPSYIDSAERAKNWNVIFPYRIKGKQKCLIVYDLDTVWVKPRVYPPESQPAEGPIIPPPLDSIYHLP